MKRIIILKFIVVLLAISIFSVCYGNNFLALSNDGSYAMGNVNKKEQKDSSQQCGLPLSDTELKKMLTPEQYRIIRQNGTEAPFLNEYWNNKRAGIYVDIVTGEPLFSSTDKFDSKTGWPSFTQPIDKDSIAEKMDASQGMTRTEVRAKNSDSHLGHVFEDGPEPTGMRYCINSAALRFIPVEDLEKEGYGKYLYLFKKGTQKDSRVVSEPKTQLATFGAGCFWGVESAFRELDGVVNTTVGYTGGTLKNPTYEDVCSDRTGHAEAVQVEFDPTKVSYQRLLEVFWSIHDSTTLNRQGPDAGTQYRSVIFYHDAEQEKAAKLSKEKFQTLGKIKGKIVTEIVPAKEFYQAEDYHQRYYEKHNIKPTCHIPK